MEDILLATGNPGKVEEIKQLMADIPVNILSAADGFEAPPVEEDLPSLEGNAQKKAHTWFEVHGIPSLADDTGLEVDALYGAPGVRSARFAGEEATDAENRLLLLAKMEDTKNRGAQFRTVVAWVHAEGVLLAEGICRGTIATEERGSEGFGYDSIFIPEGFRKTFAELPPRQKNEISHRRRALDSFLFKLKPFLKDGSPGAAS